MAEIIHKIDSIPFRIKRLFKSKRRKIIWARVACLGKDTYELFKNDEILYNTQKGRIDYLSGLFLNGKKSSPFYKGLGYIKRKDIRRLIIEQFYIDVSFSNDPILLLMDSYSELTDQKFVDKEINNSFFFANYSDLDGSFREHLICEGLLELDEHLIKYYLEFFNNFRKKYPRTPIVFINFPKKFEKREKFIERHDFIKKTISDVSKMFTDFYILSVPEEIVEKSSDDDFPYHYSGQVYKYLSDEIVKLNLLKN